jgi:hypothetical protein
MFIAGGRCMFLKEDPASCIHHFENWRTARFGRDW